MISTNLDSFVESNKSFQKQFCDGDKPLPPARKTAIATCMDARGTSLAGCIEVAGNLLLGTDEIYVM